MPKLKTDEHLIAYRGTKADWEALGRIAEKNGSKPTWALRQAVKEYLTRHGEARKPAKTRKAAKPAAPPTEPAPEVLRHSADLDEPPVEDPIPS